MIRQSDAVGVIIIINHSKMRATIARYLPDVGKSVTKVQLLRAPRILRVTTAHDRLEIDTHRGSGGLWSVGWYEY